MPIGGFSPYRGEKAGAGGDLFSPRDFYARAGIGSLDEGTRLSSTYASSAG